MCVCVFVYLNVTGLAGKSQNSLEVHVISQHASPTTGFSREVQLMTTYWLCTVCWRLAVCRVQKQSRGLCEVLWRMWNCVCLFKTSSMLIPKTNCCSSVNLLLQLQCTLQKSVKRRWYLHYLFDKRPVNTYELHVTNLTNS